MLRSCTKLVKAYHTKLLKENLRYYVVGSLTINSKFENIEG
jgi:hypothetical protein